MNNLQNALQSAERLLEKYRQQEATANACGFQSWAIMQFAQEYAEYGLMAQEYAEQIRFAETHESSMFSAKWLEALYSVYFGI